MGAVEQQQQQQSASGGQGLKPCSRFPFPVRRRFASPAAAVRGGLRASAAGEGVPPWETEAASRSTISIASVIATVSTLTHNTLASSAIMLSL